MAEPGDNCGPTTESGDPSVPDEAMDCESPRSGQEETTSRRTAKPSGNKERRGSGSCTSQTKGPKRRRAVTQKARGTKRRRSVTKKSGGSKRRCTNTTTAKRRRGNTKKGRSSSRGRGRRGCSGSTPRNPPRGGPRVIVDKKPNKPTGKGCPSPVKKPRKSFKPAVGPENRKRPPGVFVSYYLDLLKRDQKEAGKKGKRPPIVGTVKKASECWKGLDDGTKDRYRKKYCAEWKRIKNRGAGAKGRC